MEIPTIFQQLSAKKTEAIALAEELREIAGELTSLADSLESGSGLPGRIHATAAGERMRRTMSKYNTLKQDIDFLKNALSGSMKKR